MANINNYPCKKCNLNIPQNTNGPVLKKVNMNPENQSFKYLFN